MGGRGDVPDGERILSGGSLDDSTVVRVWLLGMAPSPQHLLELHTAAVTCLMALPGQYNALSAPSTIQSFFRSTMATPAHSDERHQS